MIRRWLLLIAVTGCYRPSTEAVCTVACSESCPAGQECGTDGMCRAIGATIDCSDQPIVDAGIDSSVDGSALICAGTFQPLCFEPARIPSPIALLDHTIDTDLDTSCTFVHANAGRDICVIAATSVSIAGTLRAQGNRPLAIWATTTIEIAETGTIDVTSPGAAAASRGAGGNWPGCPVAPIAGMDVSSSELGAGGGAGGTFASQGGSGGGSPILAMRTMPAAIVAVPTTLRGGCRGGDGGDATAAQSTGGTGGSSGGAVYIVAGSRIATMGAVLAWGGGAQLAGYGAGGGGGGSGGMIVLDAPSLAFGPSAILQAVGGGGGTGGGHLLDGVPGDDISRGEYATSVASGHEGGTGGGGSAPTIAVPGNDGKEESTGGDNGGGGGGGGGAGYILLRGISSGNAPQLLPPATP